MPVKETVQRIPQGSRVVPLVRVQHAFAHQRSYLRLAQLNRQAQQPRLPALAMKLHTVGGCGGGRHVRGSG